MLVQVHFLDLYKRLLSILLVWVHGMDLYRR